MEYGSCYDELEKEKWDFAFIGIGSEQRDIRECKLNCVKLQ